MPASSYLATDCTSPPFLVVSLGGWSSEPLQNEKAPKSCSLPLFDPAGWDHSSTGIRSFFFFPPSLTSARDCSSAGSFLFRAALRSRLAMSAQNRTNNLTLESVIDSKRVPYLTGAIRFLLGSFEALSSTFVNYNHFFSYWRLFHCLAPDDLLRSYN